MKKTLLILLLSVLAAGCGRETAPKPKHLLKEEDMVNILYDISLLQAISSYQPLALDSGKVDIKNYIYKKYAIDSATFAQNQAYYASSLEKYEGIQKRLSERLAKEKKQATPPKEEKSRPLKKDPAIIAKGKAKRDSLQKVYGGKPSSQKTGN